MADETPKKPGLLTLEWFAPIERRVILLVLVGIWVAFEWFVSGDQLFGIVAPAVFAYGVWTFFITFDAALAKHKNDKPQN